MFTNMCQKSNSISVQVQIVLLAAFAVLVACSPQPVTISEVPEVTDNVRIVLFANESNLQDSSFYSLTYDGLRSVSARFGFDFAVSAAADGYSDNVEGFDFSEVNNTLGEGVDIAVIVGFPLVDLTNTLAEQYPDIHFIGTDQFQGDVVDNITGVVFAEVEAGYLAGVLAANLSETNIIGGVYGPDFAPIAAFANGYEQGAKSVNPDIEIISDFHPDVATGFADPEWGATTATTQLDAGADVIFTAAGGTGVGALEIVAERAVETEGLYCIGVDTDQWLTVPSAQSCLVSSAIKNIPAAIDEVVTLIVNGNPPSGNFFGPVGLASFHDFSNQFSDLRIELDQIQVDIESGTLSIE